MKLVQVINPLRGFTFHIELPRRRGTCKRYCRGCPNCGTAASCGDCYRHSGTQAVRTAWARAAPARAPDLWQSYPRPPQQTGNRVAPLAVRDRVPMLGAREHDVPAAQVTRCPSGWSLAAPQHNRPEDVECQNKVARCVKFQFIQNRRVRPALAAGSHGSASLIRRFIMSGSRWASFQRNVAR